jgi:hypothetical protein
MQARQTGAQVATSRRLSVHTRLVATVTIDEIVIADDPDVWRGIGFEVVADRVQIGSVWLRFAGRHDGAGIIGWSLRDLCGEQLDGLPTTISTSEQPRAVAHQPNGVCAIDHVVAISPQLDRSVEALCAAGLDLRRIREEPTPAGAPRQAFFRLGEEILEVIQEPEEVVERNSGSDRPLAFWGIALRVDDLPQTVAALAGHSSEIRPAIQPGRHISSIRRSAGLAIPVALIS